MEAFASFCVLLLSLCPSFITLADSPQIPSSVVSEILSFLGSSFSDNYFPCCLTSIGAIMKHGYTDIQRKREADISGHQQVALQGMQEGVLRDWRSLCETSTRQAISYLEVRPFREKRQICTEQICRCLGAWRVSRTF